LLLLWKLLLLLLWKLLLLLLWKLLLLLLRELLSGHVRWWRRRRLLWKVLGKLCHLRMNLALSLRSLLMHELCLLRHLLRRHRKLTLSLLHLWGVLHMSVRGHLLHLWLLVVRHLSLLLRLVLLMMWLWWWSGRHGRSRHTIWIGDTRLLVGDWARNAAKVGATGNHCSATHRCSGLSRCHRIPCLMICALLLRNLKRLARRTHGGRRDSRGLGLLLIGRENGCTSTIDVWRYRCP
jgi:hypothetical protein